jgi:hypothetical protein
MRNKPIKLTLGIIALLAAADVAANDFSLDWWTVDSGGEMFTTGGDFELSGTVGQPDANTIVMTGGEGEYELTGGFWAVSLAEPEPIPGDLDGDGDVDLTDLARLLAAYGSCVGDPDYDPAADLDGSGCVDLPDLAILLSHYGEGM